MTSRALILVCSLGTRSTVSNGVTLRLGFGPHGVLPASARSTDKERETRIEQLTPLPPSIRPFRHRPPTTTRQRRLPPPDRLPFQQRLQIRISVNRRSVVLHQTPR